MFHVNCGGSLERNEFRLERRVSSRMVDSLEAQNFYQAAENSSCKADWLCYAAVLPWHFQLAKRCAACIASTIYLPMNKERKEDRKGKHPRFPASLQRPTIRYCSLTRRMITVLDIFDDIIQKMLCEYK